MARKNSKKIKIKKSSIFRFTDSYTSLILGAIVVLITGILFVSFITGNRSVQISSTKEVPEMELESDGKTSSTYTIKVGDDLWSISENIYSDGYKWVEIARANNLENPGLILVGNKLIIPGIEKKETGAIAENNAISSTTYTIERGDNLWNIAVRAYGDGFKWPDLAEANHLENPDLIFSGNVLKLPRT